MKKPWEERWERDISGLLFPGGKGIDLHDEGEEDDTEDSPMPHCEARAMLAAAAPDMARALLAVVECIPPEWLERGTRLWTRRFTPL